jgi:hypothetical protein
MSTSTNQRPQMGMPLGPKSRSLSVAVGTLCLSLLAWPLSSASAQDPQGWQKPWDSTAARPARTPTAIPAPSRLGADDQDAPPAPYYSGGNSGENYSSPSYGSSPRQTGNGYGQAESNAGTGQYSQAPYGTAQGYGSSPSNQTYGNSPTASPSGGYGSSQPQTQGYGSQSGGYAAPQGRGNDAYQAPRSSGGTASDGYGAPYSAPGQAYEPEPTYGERSQRAEPRYDQAPPRYDDEPTPGRNGGGGYYSQNEISQAGHGFFGSVTRGLASAIEYTFKKSGRPNGYILGEDGGGAFIAGLRYGEGTMFTKDAGQRKIYWQGPSLGYDVGAEGSKTMVLVYNMRDIGDMFHRFGGIEGSAYLIGGVSVQFQKYGDVTLALIRSGVGLRLGANVGYLKYSPKPTWNPF